VVVVHAAVSRVPGRVVEVAAVAVVERDLALALGADVRGAFEQAALVVIREGGAHE
jgi:hypothetical protein